MAYVATVTVTHRREGGRRIYKVVVAETGITGATDEWSVATIPVETLTLLSQSATVTPGGGSATTIDPQIQAAASGAKVLYANGAAAATIYNTNLNTVCNLVSRVLYGRSGANGTADSCSTTMYFAEGAAL